MAPGHGLNKVFCRQPTAPFLPKGIYYMDKKKSSSSEWRMMIRPMHKTTTTYIGESVPDSNKDLDEEEEKDQEHVEALMKGRKMER